MHLVGGEDQDRGAPGADRDRDQLAGAVRRSRHQHGSGDHHRRRAPPGARQPDAEEGQGDRRDRERPEGTRRRPRPAIREQNGRGAQHGGRSVPVADRICEPPAGSRHVASPAVEDARLQVGEHRDRRDDAEAGGESGEPLSAAGDAAGADRQREQGEVERDPDRLVEGAALIMGPPHRRRGEQGDSGQTDSRQGCHPADRRHGQRPADQSRDHGRPGHNRGRRVSGRIEEALGKSGGDDSRRNQARPRVLSDRCGHWTPSSRASQYLRPSPNRMTSRKTIHGLIAAALVSLAFAPSALAGPAGSEYLPKVPQSGAHPASSHSSTDGRPDHHAAAAAAERRSGGSGQGAGEEEGQEAQGRRHRGARRRLPIGRIRRRRLLGEHPAESRSSC